MFFGFCKSNLTRPYSGLYAKNDVFRYVELTLDNDRCELVDVYTDCFDKDVPWTTGNAEIKLGKLFTRLTEHTNAADTLMNISFDESVVKLTNADYPGMTVKQARKAYLLDPSAEYKSDEYIFDIKSSSMANNTSTIHHFTVVAAERALVSQILDSACINNLSINEIEPASLSLNRLLANRSIIQKGVIVYLYLTEKNLYLNLLNDSCLICCASVELDFSSDDMDAVCDETIIRIKNLLKKAGNPKINEIKLLGIPQKHDLSKKLRHSLNVSGIDIEVACINDFIVCRGKTEDLSDGKFEFAMGAALRGAK